MVTQQRVQWDKKYGELIKELRRAKSSLKKENQLRCKANENLVRYQKLFEDVTAKLDMADKSLLDERKLRLTMNNFPDDAFAIGKEIYLTSVGGGKRWPVRIVLLIMRLLCDGVRPTAIPSTIQTMHFTLRGVTAEELPSVSFVRECRTIMQNLNELIAAFWLAKTEKWRQLFTDGTSRRQIPFINVAIGVTDTNGTLVPIIVSSCMVVKNETAEEQVSTI